MRLGAALAGLLAISCGGRESGLSGPALEPRPETQTCLADPSLGMPERLSDTGCFDDLEALEPGPDLIPYEVNSALWTDGAFKPRFMVIPPEEKIHIDEDGEWEFPEGSILIKVFGFDFAEGRRAVETRFMVRKVEGWEYATYRWNDEGTEATLLTESETAEYTVIQNGSPRVVEYRFPDYNACVTCHRDRAAEVLGPKTAQINRQRNYDGIVANQLRAMDDIGLFAPDTEGEIDPSLQPKMASPQLGTGSLEDRARAYLDANCAHCHRPGGWAPADSGLDVRYETALAETGLCDPMKYFGWAGMPRVAPGDPANSGVLRRIQREDSLRMPPLGISTVDPLGVSVLSGWIAELEACP